MREFFLNYWKQDLVVLALILTVLLGTLYKVEKRIVADEWLWVPLGVRFIDPISEGNFAGTHISARPGVPVAWVSGITSRVASFLGTVKIERGKSSIILSENDFVINRISFGLLTVLLLVVLFLLCNQLFGWRTAAAISSLIATNPFFLLKGDTVWTDLLLAFFMFFAVILYQTYIEKKDRKYLFFAGVSFGLAIATKSVAILLVPTIFFVAALHYRSRYKQIITDTIIFAFSGFLTFFLIYPYLWSKILAVTDRYSVLAKEVEYSSVKDTGTTRNIYYFQELFFNNPIVLTLSIPATFFLIKFRKSLKISPVILTTTIAFTIYLGILIFVSQIGTYTGGKIAFKRYLTPAVMFLSLFFVLATEALAKRKLKYLWIFPIAAICFNIYTVLISMPCDANEC